MWQDCGVSVLLLRLLLGPLHPKVLRVQCRKLELRTDLAPSEPTAVQGAAGGGCALLGAELDVHKTLKAQRLRRARVPASSAVDMHIARVHTELLHGCQIQPGDQDCTISRRAE